MNTAEGEREVVRLAGRLFTRPIGPDSYRLHDLLAGLAAERERLGQR